MITYSQTSRYYGIKEEDGIIQTDLITMNTSFLETTVRSGEQGQPELLSQRVYGNPNYWWVICRYNGIIDPAGMWEGLKIRYPDITRPPREGI